MEDKLNSIGQSYQEQIKSATTLAHLDELFLKAFGKTGEITLLPKDFPTLPKEELRVIGPLFNKVKTGIEQAIEQRRQELREDAYSKLAQESADFSDTTIKHRQGMIHPLSQFEQEINDLFGKLGFQRFDAPHIDSDHYNFEVLNIPKEHPARDLWDTLYVDVPESTGVNPGKLLLRTHTSNAQVRIMEQMKPPFRQMIVGPCYRYENVDARHDHTFTQFEIVYVDKGLSMANLQYLSEHFMKAIFGQEVKVRLRPKYYPFVEPGAGVDGLCMNCKGEGCSICGGVGWIELAGAGMIHPVVLKNGGIDPEEYSGIAWGFGLERILMIKDQLTDIRPLRNGDIKLLQQIAKQRQESKKGTQSESK